MQKKILTFVVITLLTSVAHAQQGVQASFIPSQVPGPFYPRHRGGDNVILITGMARPAWSTPSGFVIGADGSNCGIQCWTFSDGYVMDKWVNDVCESNGRAMFFPVADPWCVNGYLVQPPGPRLIGIVGDEIVYRKCNGAAYRWRPQGIDIAISVATTNWIELCTDEGTHVLSYGTYGLPLGLQVVNSTGSGITLGQVLYPPNDMWQVSDFSLKSDSITVRVAIPSIGAQRVDLYTKSGAVWTLSASYNSTQLGARIVGIGDRRAAIWSADNPMRIAVLRLDSSPPLIETVFTLPNRADGSSYTDIPFAYARRGSIVCSTTSATGSNLCVGNRSEQTALCPGDLNADRVIDGADIGILLEQWGAASPFSVADINRNGIVDGADLGTLLTRWGPCPN